MEVDKKKIKVLPNGPYQVTGNVPLNQLTYVNNKNDASTGYQETQTFKGKESYYLCRCGKSKRKPFCDGAHLNDFNGKEVAPHSIYGEMAEKTEGRYMDLLDAEELCSIARFCDTHGSTWKLINDDTNPDREKIVQQQCANCPSGRLTAITKDGKLLEPTLPREISILEDLATSTHGPVWVKGSIPIEDAEGRFYPIRNRVTLCRCGLSKNKPFCDGSHIKNKGDIDS